MPIFGCTAGNSFSLASERGGRRRVFQLAAADLGERHLRVQDELTGDLMCDAE
jgi:hypothetical protein